MYGIECVEERATSAATRMDKIVQGRKKMNEVGKVPAQGRFPLDQGEHCARMGVNDKPTDHSCLCVEKCHHIDREPLNMSEDQQLHNVDECPETAAISLTEEQIGAAVKDSNCFSLETALMQRSRCHGDSDTLAGRFSVVSLTIKDSDESLLQFEKLLKTVSSHGGYRRCVSGCGLYAVFVYTHVKFIPILYINSLCGLTLLGNDRVCLIGLHCCGDLTPTIMRWFSRSVTPPSLKALVVVGCCYHKMADSEDMSGQSKVTPIPTPTPTYTPTSDMLYIFIVNCRVGVMKLLDN